MENEYQKVYLSGFDIKRRRNIRVLVVAIIFIACLVITESVFYQKTKKEIRLSSVASISELPSKKQTPTKNHSNKDVSLLATDCILKPNKNQPPTSVERLWILNYLLQETKKNEYLEQIYQEINSLNNIPSSNSPLSCSLLFDVYQNKTISIEQKEKIKNLCLSFFTENNIGALRQLENPTQSFDNIIDQQNVSPKIIEEYDLKFDIEKLSSFSLAYLYKHQFTQDQDDLEKGQKLLAQAISAYYQKENWLYPEICLMGSAFLEYYQISPQNNFLPFAKRILDSAKTVTNLKNINLSSQAYCSNFFTQYANISKEDSVLKLSQSLLNTSMERNFDARDFAAYRADTKCFFDSNDRQTSHYLENILIINSLAKN